MTVFFRASGGWHGKVHADGWRADDAAEPPLSPPVVWTGPAIFQRPEVEVTVEQATHDKAARAAKGIS